MGSDGEWALDRENGEYVWNGEEWDGEGAWCEKPEQPEGVPLANADTAGIVIKSRAISDSIWRQPGATVWTKLIPAGNLVSSHQ